MTSTPIFADTPDEERKAALRSAAFRLVRRTMSEEGPEGAAVLPLSWLDPQDVADEADLPIEIFEKLWGDPEPDSDPERDSDFERDSDSDSDSKRGAFKAFLFEAFSVDRSQGIQQERVGGLAGVSKDFEELVRTDAACPTPKEDTWLSYRMALACSAYGGHKRLDYEYYLLEIEFICQHLIYRSGRRLREGLTYQHMAITLAAVFEGAWLRRLYGVPDANRTFSMQVSPDSEVKEWTLDGVSAWAVISGMTELVE